MACQSFLCWRKHGAGEFCPAHSNVDDFAMCWANFTARAKWKLRPFTVEQWGAMHSSISHQIFKVFTFLSQHNIEPDELHVHGANSTYLRQRSVATLFLVFAEDAV